MATKRRRVVRAVIDWDDNGQPVVTTDIESFAAMVGALDGDLHHAKHVTEGGKQRGHDRHAEREARDQRIAGIAARYTGEPRDLVAHIVRVITRTETKPVKAAAVRRALKRIRSEK